MMQPFFWLVLLAAALASCIGGLLLCLRAWSRKALFAMISAGAGLLLAITMLDLMPHVIQGESLRMMPFVLVGFAALFALELLGKAAGGGNRLDGRDRGAGRLFAARFCRRGVARGELEGGRRGRHVCPAGDAFA
ncbi:hypothetical protein [Brevibacillus agri]|uniref:hypothetical protein n=1 Tax=Brevibacillus agri TaxID=51101 RepID=UPI003D7153E4